MLTTTVYNINVYLLLDLNAEFLVPEWAFNSVSTGCSIRYINPTDSDDGIHSPDAETEHS